MTNERTCKLSIPVEFVVVVAFTDMIFTFSYMYLFLAEEMFKLCRNNNKKNKQQNKTAYKLKYSGNLHFIKWNHFSI